MRKIGLLLLLTVQFNVFSQNADVERLKVASVKAMGGQKAYDNTRYISWTFFGNRNLVWDKFKNTVRIDYLKENTVLIVNMSNQTGKVLKKGTEMTQPDSLSKYLEQARRAWINDSYWLVMPFKLSDPGLSTKYLGKLSTEAGVASEAIELTFQSVGVTPDNKYIVLFDPLTSLVSEWRHFTNYKDEKPRFTNAWTDYKKYGNILLSSGRGARTLDNIKVFKKLDKSVFEDFTKPEFIK
jgi:hypothetical protein